MPITKKTGTLKLSDILSQEPSAQVQIQNVQLVDTPSLTQVEPVKPTFKSIFDLTFKEKAKLSTAKITKGW